MIFTHLRKACFAAVKMVPFVEFYNDIYGGGSEKTAKRQDFYSIERGERADDDLLLF